MIENSFWLSVNFADNSNNLEGLLYAFWFDLAHKIRPGQSPTATTKHCVCQKGIKEPTSLLD
jgi:hypothetical protein